MYFPGKNRLWRLAKPVVPVYKNGMRKYIFILCMLCMFPSLAFAWNGTVVKINDGDTFTVRVNSNNEVVTVRLWGIICPQYQQPYGKETTALIRDLLPVGTPVLMDDRGRDNANRSVSVVGLPDGRIVQTELLKAGFAWVDWGYCDSCTSWYALEHAARRAHKGVWGGENAIPPGARKEVR